LNLYTSTTRDILNFGYQDTVTRRYDDFIKALKMHALLLL